MPLSSSTKATAEILLKSKFFSSSINDNKQSDSGLSENSPKLSSLLKLCALKEISNYILMIV